METDVEGLIGVARHERSPDRLNYRNGCRDRTLDTRLGTLALRVPKLRQGSYFPPFLEPRRMTEKALVAVIQKPGSAVSPPVAWTTWCRPWGSPCISKSQVSKLCKDIDERVMGLSGAAFGRGVALSLARRHLPEAAQRGPVVSVAAIIAVAVNTDGRREIIGLRDRSLGSRDLLVQAFSRPWCAVGLKGVKLVVSDAHEGLKQAIRPGAERDLAALPGPLDAQRPGPCAERPAHHRRAAALAPGLPASRPTGCPRQTLAAGGQLSSSGPAEPKLATLMDESEHDVLAYLAFPAQSVAPSFTPQTRWSA